MKVHHLNCGTMNLLGAPLVCHVLVVETDRGLALIDSGFGTADCHDPAGRIGMLRHVSRPTFDLAETAANQLDRLGFRREDVRDIVVTHLDIDHVGGISDFPHARVHITAAEALAAFGRPSRQEKIRYGWVQWARDAQIVEHDPSGEAWRGFAAAKELADIAPGIVLISMPGHTRGHACVAVDAGHRWVLHCGDAFYHRGTVDDSAVSRVLRAQESLIAYDRKQVRDNHARLGELYRQQDPELLIVCSHDPTLYEHANASA